MKIIFMGTPDFAVASLAILHEAGYDICAVITATDKPFGRGKKQLYESPVKKYAVEQGIDVLQPKNLKNQDFLSVLAAYKADLQIVVAFRMLPVAVWDMPSLGTYNLHGSLLPKYRGAAPLNWAIMNGDKWTGLTTFKLKHQIDTGSLFMASKVPIYSSDTLKQVHDRMQAAGAQLVLKSVKAIESNQLSLHEQDESKVSHAPKLYHKDLEIDFSKNTRAVYNYVRGLNPFPSAWTRFEGKKIKVFDVNISNDESQSSATNSDYKNYIRYKCSDGYVEIKDLQMEGKKRMKVKDFLRGYNPA